MNCPTCQAENSDSASACSRCGATLTSTPTAVFVTVDLSPGTLFHGRYEILGPLGRGGMGMVYKARDRTLDEVVAIKILRPEFAKDPQMAQRFKSEIKLARKVRHKNVCTIHDYGEEQGLLYISMEYIEGVDLKRILKQQGALAVEEAYDVAIQVAEGLQAVHEAGIIHRDLKTPNIMRDGKGLARLMDFGVAKRHGSEGTITGTGNIVGTPEYMSPEQAQGHKLDFRSDIYALGVVSYEIFTGNVPFKGDTPISTILKHLNEPPPLEGPAAARLPLDLKPVLRKALAKEPALRYASAQDFAEALRDARSPSRRQQPVATEVLQAPTWSKGPASRRARVTASAWLVTVPLVLAAGGYVWVRARSGSAEAPRPTESIAQVAATPPPAPSAAAPSLPAVTPPPPESPAPAPVQTPSPRTVASAKPTPKPAPSKPERTPAVVRDPVSPRVLLPLAPAPTPAPTPSPVPVATPPPPRVEPATQAKGYLLVTANPWATIAVDGKYVGETPLERFPLPAGAHRVVVRNPLYEPKEYTVVIKPDEIEKVDANFPRDGVRKQ